MALAEDTAAVRTPSSREEGGASPRERFTELLNNARKGGPARGEAVRERGFVVLARNVGSLQVFQDWCEQQTWNDCLAIRYRIGDGPVFGTLLAAFASDLDRIRSDIGALGRDGQGATRGSCRFAPDSGWPELLADFESHVGPPDLGAAGASGALRVDDLERMLRRLADALPAGRRLVLLAEVEGASDAEEWELAKRELFPRLPERIGLVLAGAPRGFELEESPSYLELDLAGVDSPVSSEEAYVYEPAALDSDRPAQDDRLDLGRYGQALARLLLHPGTGPMTVAIHGPWGKGKSSFMAFLRRALAAAAEEQGAAGAGGARDVVAVEFNAWRYEDSTQIWAGLASAVTSGLEEALPMWRRWATPVAYAWHRHRAQLVLDLIFPALVAASLVALAALGVPRLSDWVETQVGSAALARFLGAVLPGAGAVVAAVWILGARVYRAFAPVSARVLSYVRRPDHREQMGYQHLVLDDIRFVHRRLLRCRPGCRTFIFIDDLDRCLPEKVVAILQAINLVLGESDFYVVLGIDTAMVHRAIAAHYSTMDGPPLPPRFAETYLQKIVQLPFHLPPASAAERAQFVGHLFSEAARQGMDAPEPTVEPERRPAPPEGDGSVRLEWSLDALLPPVPHVMKPVADTPVELRAFLDLQDWIADNPRELKRLVNVHRFAKIVLQQEGRPVADDMQRKLVAWLVFCERWPDLFDDVLTHAWTASDCTSPLAEAVEALDPEAATFARQIAADVPTVEDLAADGPLARAAMISRLVVWAKAEPAAAAPPER